MGKENTRITFKDAAGRWVIACNRFWRWFEHKYPSHIRGEAVDRLAAYEDTGLEPEEIVQLIDKRKGLEQVKMFEVTEVLGPYETPKVVLFNKNRISYDEALWCVRAGEYNDNVVCLEKRQFYAIFRDGKEAEDGDQEV